MIDSIKGILTLLTAECAVIETHGIGYKVHIPLNLYLKTPRLGETITLYTFAVYREDSQRLFGFSTRKDQELFEKLLQVTGIGPKVALSLIGHLEAQQLEKLIAAKDSLSLAKIPGIGKKTAERLILELKDKLHKGLQAPIANDPFTEDGMKALMQLGYPQKEAYQMIQKALKIDSDCDLATLIKRALQQAHL